MNNYDFYAIVLNNVNLFITIIIGSFILHYLVFRHQITSILDPYFLAVISSVFCTADVVLLYYTDNISHYVFSSYVLTQGAFFLGLYTISFNKILLKLKNGKQPHRNYSHGKTIIAFYFFSFIYLISQILIYVLKGIPLFMQSRLETFADGGGSGVLGRITDVTAIFSLYLFFAVIDLKKFTSSEIPKYLVLCLIFVTFLLSGSKGSFLVVFSVFWCYIIFAFIKNGDYMIFLRILKTKMKFVVIASIAIVSLIIFIQSQSQIENPEERLNPIFALILRFVHSGDVYWYAYPNNVYLKIDGNRGFAALFNDMLGFLRIYSWTELPEAIGITFKNIHHPSDIPQGPNARHNVFGLIYYGFFLSIIFSFILGLILGFVRNKLPYLLNANILGGFIFTYLMIKSSSIDSDPMLTITYITNLVFIFPFIYLAYLVFIEILKANPLKNELPI
jgi:oligosaccharide repeat unit polymerase